MVQLPLLFYIFIDENDEAAADTVETERPIVGGNCNPNN